MGRERTGRERTEHEGPGQLGTEHGRTEAARAGDEPRRPGAVGAAQAALAVLVVGGAVLGALLLHPGAGLLHKGRGPLGGNPVLVAGIAALALLGVSSLRGTYLEHVHHGRELDAVEQRLVDTVSRVLLAAVVVVPLLVLLLHRFGTPGGGTGDHPAAGFGHPRQGPQPTLPPPKTPHPAHPGHAAHYGLLRVLLGLCLASLVVAFVFAGLYLWRYLTRRPVPAGPVGQAAPDKEQDRLAQAVDSGRRALLDTTDPRAAVIACYAAMEESLAGSGVARRASDSPQDLLERAVAGGLPAGAAAGELTALFREARYSTHPMNGSHRDRAAATLAEIADSLRPRTAADRAEAGAS